MSTEGGSAPADGGGLVQAATEYYLSSPDFNGLPLVQVLHASGAPPEALRSEVCELVSAGKLAVRSAHWGNPHVRQFGPDKPEVEAGAAREHPIEELVVYPSRTRLAEVVDRMDYADRPFTRELALGAAQLDFRAFDLSVLEWYRNDPRYIYETNDVGGWISISDEWYDADELHERDSVLLKTFGFAYDQEDRRAVAVFCVYLHNLSPEHQQVWAARQLAGDYRLHPDYFRTSYLGEWPERISIFQAFIEELCVLNGMAEAMDRPPLFRETFKDARPRNFAFVVRPTLSELHAFALTLDKMMSDNLNRKFFKGEVPTETETTRKDGKVIVQQRGTIAMLEQWVTTAVRLRDPAPFTKSIAAFRRVRRLRQRPAHSLHADNFDPAYFQEQRDLMKDAYNAVRVLRLLFANHPAVRAADLPISRELSEGLIWAR